MRWLLIFIFMLGVDQVLAQGARSKTNKTKSEQKVNLKIMKLGMAHFTIGVRDQDSLVLSYDCFNKNSKCQALKAFNKIKPKLLSPIDTEGGKNPGAEYCKEILKQKVIILVDAEANETSFCQFADGSLIANSSIEAKIK